MNNNIYRLSNLDIEKWRKKSDQVIIPIGSLEQHGDHLPVSTDSIIIEHLAKKVSEKFQCLYLPTITFGISFEHQPLFNISLSHQTYSNFISEICLSLVKYGMKNIILLNGHHGNMGCLYYISQNVSDKIHSNTKLVKMKMARANTKEIAGSRIAYTSLTTNSGSFPKITGNGVWGDPTKASIIKGRSLLENLTQKIVEIIKEFKNFS